MVAYTVKESLNRGCLDIDGEDVAAIKDSQYFLRVRVAQFGKDITKSQCVPMATSYRALDKRRLKKRKTVSISTASSSSSTDELMHSLLA